MSPARDSSNRRILVTGGAGFIGSHLVEALIARGDTPVVVDDLSTGDRANLPLNVSFCQCDIAGPQLTSIFEEYRFDAVVHCAAQVKVLKSMEDPDLDRRVNLLGTAALLNLCRSQGVRRFVFLSTGGALYGETEEPAREETLPRPQSYYAVHKYTAERYVELSGLGYAILRLANVYGSRQRSDLEGGVVSIFIDRLLQRLPIYVFGTGEQVRDFVYIKDVVEAMLAVLYSERNGLWNVGTGVPTTVNQLLRLLTERLGQSAGTRYLPPKAGEIFRSYLDISKIMGEGLWSPKYTLAEGLRETVDSLLEARRHP